MKKKRSKSILEQSPEVIDRWVRQKMLQHSQNLGRTYARLTYNRSKEKKRIKDLEGAFNEIKDQLIRLEHQEYSATKTIFNAAFFLLLIERDFSAIKWEALTHPDPWKRNLLTRVILLILYESDMDKVTGQKLKIALDTLDIPDDLRKRVNASLKSIRIAYKNSGKMLGEIRNSTIAHRDPDALLQYRTIRNLDTLKVFELAVGFYDAADEFISVFPQIMIRAGTINGFVTQIIKKQKFSQVKTNK